MIVSINKYDKFNIFIMSSIFYSLSQHVLLEIDYTLIPLNNISFPLELISDDNSKSRTIVNKNNGFLTTNNIKDNTFVTNNVLNKVILDNDTGYYYPNFDNNIIISDIITSNIDINYITVRLHILSGYNFQDSSGITFSLFTKDTDGKNVFLLNQSFLKSNINRYKYNSTPKKIGTLYYDKYLEFLCIDYNNIITNGNNHVFFENKINFSKKSIIYASLTTIKNIDNTNGYPILIDDDNKSISFAPNDEFGLLSANIFEHQNKYIVYEALWDGQPIENIIYKLNSISGNDYYVIHDLEIYEQRGLSLLLIDNVSQAQTSNYDVPKRFRPILSNYADGGMKIIYTVRLFNRVSGDSIIKKSEISVVDITPYQEEIGKINIIQLDNPIKVYNKLTNNDINISTDEQKLNKILVPMYINSFGVSIEDGFILNIAPFDNIYKIKLFTNLDNKKSVLNIQPNVFHELIFMKENGNQLSVKELVDNNDRKYGILTFKINGETAKNIISNGIKKFYITVESNNVRTKLTSGTVS